MTRFWKDVVATVATLLAVLAAAAAQQGWTSVPLAGSSVRWGAGAILLLGMVACSMAEPAKDRLTPFLAALGVAALALAIGALATGSTAWLWALTGVTVALWALATARHYEARHHHLPHGPTPAH